MSIRTRLAIAVAIVLVATLALAGVALVRSTRATLVEQVDDQVRTNAASAGGRYDKPRRGGDDYGGRRGSQGESDDDTGDPFERPVAYLRFSATGTELQNDPCGFEGDPKPDPSVPPIPSEEIDELVGRIVTTPAVDGSLDYRMLVQRYPSGEISVTAAPLDATDAAIERLIRNLLVVGAVALAVATMASWWLIRRGLRPVDRMVDTAAAIAAGDLSRRVPADDPRSELGRLGGALNEMLHQIEGAVQARAASEDRLRRFVADAAHELRTPLTSLRGYAELYRQGALPDQGAVANAMGRIEAEGARMARLVDDLLLLARLDQQRGLETKPVDLVAVAREAVADFGAAAPDRPVTLDLAETAVVQGDRTRLRQVLDNLLTNARTHTPAGTAVHVTVKPEGHHAVLTVRDEGPGITPEDQARVFERFWRADPARSRGRGGTGLGLAIVASLVEAHGGTVALASRPGQGAAFTVRVPLAPTGDRANSRSSSPDLVP